MLLDKAIASKSTKYWESIDPDLKFHMFNEGWSQGDITHAVQEDCEVKDDDNASPPVDSPIIPSAANTTCVDFLRKKTIHLLRAKIYPFLYIN